MLKIKEILGVKVKPKEKTVALARELKENKVSMNSLVEFFENAKDSEKGTCMAAITLITKDNPKFIENYLDFVVSQIKNKAPRVKWEASETVANVAKELIPTIPAGAGCWSEEGCYFCQNQLLGEI